MNSYIGLGVGPYCKKNCVFCNEGGAGIREQTYFIKKNNKVYLDINKTINYIEKINKNINQEKKIQVIYGGGEPLYIENLEILSEELKKKGYSIGLVTSGIFIKNTEDITKVKNILKNVDQVLFSFHSGNKEINEKITGVKGSLKEEIEFVKLLSDNKKIYNYELWIQEVVMSINLDQFFKDIMLLYKNFDINYIHGQDLEPIGKGKEIFKKMFVNHQQLANKLTIFDKKTKGKFRNKFNLRIPFCMIGEELHCYISEKQGLSNYSHEYKFKKCTNCEKKSKCWGTINTESTGTCVSSF